MSQIVAIFIASALACLMLLERSGRADAWDRRILTGIHSGNFNQPRRRSRKTQRFMYDMTALAGDTMLMVIIFMALCLCFATRSIAILPIFLLPVAAARFVGWGLKKMIRRSRPDFVSDAPRTFTTSFPSVHSLMAMVVFGWLGFILPSLLGWQNQLPLNIFAATLIFMIGYGRLYLGVHWPSDVIAGWLIGLLILLICSILY